jgi:acetyl esterase/lipase
VISNARVFFCAVIGTLSLSCASMPVVAGSVPASIFTDPPHDPKFPAGMAVLHIPSHGVQINGVAYQPTGAGPHPVLVIFHGLPGNEKNLDLAQSVRRAGWVAVTFNYRGSWGSPGTFSFAGNLEDAEAVLAYLRDPKTATSLGIDPQRIAIAGHSMGGWVAAKAAAHDQKLIGVAVICGADMGRLGTDPHDKTVELMADNKESLAGVTAQSMADEVAQHSREFSLPAAAAGLAGTPLLVLTSDDGLAADGNGLAKAVRDKGNQHVTTRHVATDHGWSDRRIALQSLIIDWLQTLH